MNEIVKICKRHGHLTIEQTYKRRNTPNYLTCKYCQNIATTKHFRKNKEKYKDRYKDRYTGESKRLSTLKSSLKKRNNMTLDEYNNLLLEQKNVCAICKKPETTFENKNKTLRRLSVDHCHSTGKIRGLLCGNCNNGLGRFKDSIELLQEAINYLLTKKPTGQSG